MCSPRLCQCPLTCLRIPFPDFDAVIGRGAEDASAIEVDVEYSNPVMVARLEVVNRRHVLLYLRNMHRQGGITFPITADPGGFRRLEGMWTRMLGAGQVLPLPRLYNYKRVMEEGQHNGSYYEAFFASIALSCSCIVDDCR